MIPGILNCTIKELQKLACFSTLHITEKDNLAQNGNNEVLWEYVERKHQNRTSGIVDVLAVRTGIMIEEEMLDIKYHF